MLDALKKILVVPALALALVGRAAWAQQAGPPPATSADASSAEAEALKHFKLADAHFDKQEWREALEEYRLSLSFKKKASTMVDIAACLKAIGSYDEALAQYEELRREFPKLSAKLEAKVVPVIAELEKLVGTLVVTGDAPAGAALVVDDRRRGAIPASGSFRLRLSVGKHGVRVEKEGFEALATTVEVKAGEENVARLEAKARKGRLSVREKHGWALAVEVDGKDVGVTPWGELVEAGVHKVRVHGFVSVEALASCEVPEGKAVAAKEGVKLGSGVETASVKLFEETGVVLGAEELDASLRVESVPPGAVVTIDGAVVGKAPWEGRLGLGEHSLGVSAGGFLPVKQAVRLDRKKQRELSVTLEREPDKTAGFRRGKGIGVGVAYGVGALGLGVFGVAGGLALSRTNALRAECGGTQCTASKQAEIDAVSSLGTASTIGLVVGSVGVATGTVVLFAVQPPERGRRAGGVGWKLGAGPGRFEIEGRF